MAARAEEREEFGRRLRSLRGTRRLQDIVNLLEAQGFRASTAKISDWERGKSAPRSREIAVFVDEALGGGGKLVEALGYRAEVDITGEQLAAALEALRPTAPPMKPSTK